MNQQEIDELKREFLREMSVYVEAVFSNVIVPRLTGEPVISDLDRVKLFFLEHCILGEDELISSRKLYDGFKDVYQDSDLSHRKFSMLVSSLSNSHGIRWKKKMSGSFWEGISLREGE